jgi:hypothetical protein
VSFIATNAAAIPAAVLKNARRVMPCLRASSDPYSLMRDSNSRCFSFCGDGMYSSLDTHWAGMGDGNAEVSAGRTSFSSSGLSMVSLRW